MAMARLQPLVLLVLLVLQPLNRPVDSLGLHPRRAAPWRQCLPLPALGRLGARSDPGLVDADVSAAVAVEAEGSQPANPFGGFGLAALSTRAARLRELLTAKEIRNDLTEAEFALTLIQTREAREGSDEDEGPSGLGGDGGGLGKMVIDVENLEMKLGRHENTLNERSARVARSVSTGSVSFNDTGMAVPPSEDAFAGLSLQQVNELLRRLIMTRALLQEKMAAARLDLNEEAEESVDERENLRDKARKQIQALTQISKALQESLSSPSTDEQAEDQDEEGAAEPRGQARDWERPTVGDQPDDGLPDDEQGRDLPFAPNITVFIREDGTVDLESAIETGKEVVRFSSELWERLNGRAAAGAEGPGEAGEGSPSFDTLLQAADQQPSVKSAFERLLVGQTALWTIRDRDARAAAAQPLAGPEETAAGVAEGLSSARRKNQRERAALRRATLAVLDYDMERLFAVIATEIDQASTDTWSASWRDAQRLLVAEFGLLDAQVTVLLGVLRASMPPPYVCRRAQALAAATAADGGEDEEQEDLDKDALAVERGELEPVAGRSDLELVEVGTLRLSDEKLLNGIDEDELSVVTAQVEELVLRCGLTPSNAAARPPEMDKDRVRNWASSLEFSQLKIDLPTFERLSKETVAVSNKFRSGFEFYSRGTKLFGDDLRYAMALCLKAIGGDTLSPREARTLRRTGKDMLTLIPVTIILIIPLSPVGHVLVFSFIQRIFPDFFPSTFTERRQNLMKLFEAVSADPNDEPSLRSDDRRRR